MASESSALLLLSMQQESIHYQHPRLEIENADLEGIARTANSYPCSLAWAQHPRIFSYPFFLVLPPFRSWKVTSAPSHRCERITYSGMWSSKNSWSWMVLVLRRRMWGSALEANSVWALSWASERRLRIGNLLFLRWVVTELGFAFNCEIQGTVLSRLRQVRLMFKTKSNLSASRSGQDQSKGSGLFT